MTSLNALTDSESLVEAWVKACSALKASPGRACSNLIYSIQNPGQLSADDNGVLLRFDRFSARAGIGSSTTVANTIFPLDSYLKNGLTGLYEDYPKDIYPKVKKNWGNYFDRLIRRKKSQNEYFVDENQNSLNPLDSIVKKIKRRIESGRGTLNHYEMVIADEGYELTTYLPERDRNYPRGGPCLSHLSFKVDSSGAVSLTAIYRSHYYVERALGNLLGLSRLLAFVAKEAGGTIGTLTCLAVHATLEASVENTGRQAIDEFLAECGVK